MPPAHASAEADVFGHPPVGLIYAPLHAYSPAGEKPGIDDHRLGRRRRADRGTVGRRREGARRAEESNAGGRQRRNQNGAHCLFSLVNQTPLRLAVPTRRGIWFALSAASANVGRPRGATDEAATTTRAVP